MLDPLVSLPSEVLSMFLERWLKLKDIVKLDSAICNRKLRTGFWTALIVINLNKLTKNSLICEYYGWMDRRRIPVKTNRVENWNLVHPIRVRLSFFQLIGTIFKLENDFRNSWLRTLIYKSCKTVNRLIISEDYYDFILTKRILASIGTCSNLRSLKLHHTQRSSDPASTTSITPIMQGCQNLESLELKDIAFNEKDASLVSTKLKTFSFRFLSKCSPLSVQAFAMIITRCKSLQQIIVMKTSRTTEDGGEGVVIAPPISNLPLHFDQYMYQLMAQHLPHLQHLRASAGDADCTGVDAMIRACTALRRVEIHPCHNLTVPTIVALLSNPRIQSLDMNSEEVFTAVFQPQVQAPSGSHQKQLGLHCFRDLTDQAVTDILQCCPALEELQVSGCANLTMHIVDQIALLCPQLEYLNVQDCALLTSDAVNSRLQELGREITSNLIKMLVMY